MNRFTALVLAALIAVPAVSAAARIGPTRVPVPVGREFPIHRALPMVLVRPGPAVVVAPRLYLAPILFGRVVVFDDGQSQVIDFGDREERPGLYSLVDFTGGRKIDHVHIVAKADTKKSDITLRLTA